MGHIRRARKFLTVAPLVLVTVFIYIVANILRSLSDPGSDHTILSAQDDYQIDSGGFDASSVKFLSRKSAYKTVSKNSLKKARIKALKPPEPKNNQLFRSPSLKNGALSKDTPHWDVISGVVVHVGSEKEINHNITFIYDSKNVCHSFRNDSLRLLIFIESDVRNGQRRQAIRDTWGHRILRETFNFRIIFLLAAPKTKDDQVEVTQEMYEFGDIVQTGDFQEYFKNLALKTLMGLTWVKQFCPEADFIMKTDDDIFMHIPNLLSALKEESVKNTQNNPLLVCHRNRARLIIRKGHPLAKYHIQWKDLPGKFFPEYCAGFGYVMSRDAIRLLYAASHETPLVFIEDVYMTGFCRHKAGVKLIDNPGFQISPQILPSQVGCAFQDGRITSHELQLNEFRDMWSKLNSQGYFCPQLLTNQ